VQHGECLGDLLTAAESFFGVVFGPSGEPTFYDAPRLLNGS
jgi:hypothetical protein